MTRDTVLIVTTSFDDAADRVINVLNDGGVRVFRLNTDLFPMDIGVAFKPNDRTVFDDGTLSVSDHQIKSVWYRRHVDPDLPAGLSRGIRDFCCRESRAFLLGAIQSIAPGRWMSRPDLIGLAEKKPYQLTVASRMGFAIPETSITNNPKAAAGWRGRLTIAKAVSSGYIRTPDGNMAIFSSLVRTKDMEDLEGLRLAPVTFQSYVEKVVDLRVTVVGEDVFAAEILSQESESSKVDWRATDDPELKHRRHELPFEMKSLCRALVQKLGLRFGAIDLDLLRMVRMCSLKSIPMENGCGLRLCWGIR